MGDLLKGKIAMVTGAASGMGAGSAKLFAQEGASVVVCDINYEGAKKVAKEINDAGGIARCYGQMDVTNNDQIKANVDAMIKEFGRIDVFCQFAGRPFGAGGNTDNIDMGESWDKTLNVNLKGNVQNVLAILPYMKKQKSGSIILCSSNGAFNPTTTVLHYHAAKAGMESVTVNLARELAPKGIRVNCIIPGPIATPFWDELLPDGPERNALWQSIANREIALGRMGTAEDIAGVALFFASKLSAYVTGNRMFVCGGAGYVYSKEQVFLGSESGINSDE